LTDCTPYPDGGVGGTLRRVKFEAGNRNHLLENHLTPISGRFDGYLRMAPCSLQILTPFNLAQLRHAP
jgi:hypothetical protein